MDSKAQIPICDPVKRMHRTFAILLVGAVLWCAGPTALAFPTVSTCGVADAQTGTIRSSSGFTALLKMHSEDDHGKETHLCATEYALQITRPDGSSMQPFQFGDSDDAWHRLLVFRIDGFSEDGNRAFVFISEGSYPQSIETLEYDMKSGKALNDTFLNWHFTKRLSRECAATLHIVGTSRTGGMVIGSDTEHGCSYAQLWELRPNKTTGSTGGQVLPENPSRLSSAIGVERLQRGTAVHVAGQRD